MKFVLESSLKRRALVVVAVTLWNNPRARLFFQDVFLSFGEKDDFSGYWLETKENVQIRVQDLMISATLKEDVSKFVDAVGREMLRWCNLHISISEMVRRIPVNFFWTPYGTIDLLKTAYSLVRDEGTEVVDRFKLACYYCLEEFISPLWFQLDEETRHRMVLPGTAPFCFYTNSLIGYWCSYIETIVPLTNCSDAPIMTASDGLTRAMIADNQEGIKFFLPKVTEDVKNVMLEVCFPMKFDRHCFSMKPKNVSHKSSMSFDGAKTAHLLLFILNIMDESQQVKLLEKFPMECLYLFLEWPLQDYFMTLYQYIGHFLSCAQFCSLLAVILRKRNVGYKDYDYRQIFIELWTEASVDNRKYILSRPSKISSLLSSLSKLEDRFAFNLIFKHLTEEQKQQLLYDAYNLILE